MRFNGIYGERCTEEIARKRCDKWMKGQPYQLREGLESRSPLRGGQPYAVRVWLASWDDQRWYFVRKCVVGRNRSEGAMLTACAYTATPIFYSESAGGLNGTE